MIFVSIFFVCLFLCLIFEYKMDVFLITKYKRAIIPLFVPFVYLKYIIRKELIPKSYIIFFGLSFVGTIISVIIGILIF